MSKSRRTRALNFLAKIDSTGIRRETFEGVEHLVVPVVALVEGVIQASNSPHPELALAEEFGQFPQGWNGRPVLLGHPKVNGGPVSANIPEVLEKEAFGQLFNTVLEGKKLKTEAWLNLDAVEKMNGDVADIIALLEAGDTIEVSTGLFAAVEAQEGEHDGESFEGIWRNVVPDHLALLPPGTIGACSIADGCGAPRLNVANGGCSGEGCDGPCCKTQVHVVGDPVEENPATRIAQAWSTLRSLLGIRDSSLGDRDRREALQAALDLEDSNRWVEVLMVFDDTFVYTEGFGDRLLERKYSIQNDGVITLGGDKTQVRPVTEFVPVNVKEDDMSKKERVAALIANAATRFNDGDQEWLLKLEDTQLVSLEPAEVAPPPDVVPEPTPVVAAATIPIPVQPVPAVIEPVPAIPTAAAAIAPLSADAYIAQAPAEVAAVLREGLSMQRSRKDELTTALLANERNRFTKDELGAFDLQTLERLASLGNVPDHSLGAGGARLHVKTPVEGENSFGAPLIAEAFPMPGPAVTNGSGGVTN